MTIKVILNGVTIDLEQNSTVITALAAVSQDASNCALAVNNEIVPRSDWGSVVINEGDEIALFQAIAGG